MKSRSPRTLTFPAGHDPRAGRGYVDFAWFAELTRQGVFFVTRLKDNAVYRRPGDPGPSPGAARGP